MQHRRMSQSTQAYRLIKQDIVWSRLGPGEKFSKAVLSERYGFGDGPTRDALNRLAQEGLVEVLPREGYIIAPVTLRQIRELFEIRQILEPEVARLAAGHLDVPDIWEIEARVGNVSDLDDRASLEQYVAANSRVHMAIALASGNDRIIRIMESILDEMERIMLLSYLLGHRSTSTENGHAPLLEALIRGDGEAASTIMRDQLEEHQHFVERAFIQASSALETVNIGAMPSGLAR